MTQFSDTSPEVLTKLRSICGDLPETTEERSFAGVRWRIRRNMFVEVRTIDEPERQVTLIEFIADVADAEDLVRRGHPFFRPGWGDPVVGMILDEDVDWTDVRELLTDSYCIRAPKKLAASVERPEP